MFNDKFILLYTHASIDGTNAIEIPQQKAICFTHHINESTKYLYFKCSYNQMINTNQYRDQFLKSQVGVGITRNNFTKKFLFTQQSQQDNYLLDRLTPTPSQLQGLSIQQQKCISYLMSEMIFRAGQSLKLPVSTTVVATSISHYFYSRVGFLDYDFRDVIMGAMFLACKSEETLRKSYEISSVFDYIFKVFEGQRMPIKVQILNSQEYEYMRKKVIEMENHILFQEGFQIFRLFDIPHRYIGGLFKAFDRHPECKKICQKAWIYLNDLYKTNVVLYYPGQTIAAAAVHMSLLKLNIKMPTVPWWILMQSNIDSIQQLIAQLQAFYDAYNSNKYSLEWVANYINELADKQHNIVNVFPVNYYRKINLDIHSQLKIPKIIISIPPILQETLPIQQEVKQQGYERKRQDSEQHSRGERKKKKKQKSKKEKKDKKKKDKKKHRSNSSRSKSKSRSPQHYKTKKIPQTESQHLLKVDLSNRNNDETPKIMKQQQAIVEAMETKNESKQTVKQMNVGNAKGLLSLVSNQLKMRQTKKQQTDIPKPQQPLFKPQPQQQESDSDDQLLAQLIQIKKSKKIKQDQS